MQQAILALVLGVCVLLFRVSPCSPCASLEIFFFQMSTCHRPAPPAGAFLWSTLELAFAVINLAVTALLGLHVRPGMDVPLLSTSLRQFWARRWNLPTTAALRAVCYTPLVNRAPPGTPRTEHDAAETAPESDAAETAHSTGAVMTRAQARAILAHRKAAQGPKPPHADSVADSAADSHESGRQPWAAPAAAQVATRAAGLCAAFVASGAVHQWVFHLIFHPGPWELRWAAFFLVQPLLIVGQDWLQRSDVWRGGFGWHPAMLGCAPAFIKTVNAF